MHHFLRKATLATAFLFAAGTMLAQPDWYQQREERYRGEEWRARMFAHIKEDLDHVQSKTFPIGRDEYRLVQTKRQLDELQNDLAAHRYNQAKLDEVIGSMQRVAADNRMSPRDRDVLNEDLQRLREYREHHERFWR